MHEFLADGRERQEPQISRDEFLAQARALLDDHAYAALEQRYDATYGHRPTTHLVSTLEGVDA